MIVEHENIDKDLKKIVLFERDEFGDFKPGNIKIKLAASAPR